MEEMFLTNLHMECIHFEAHYVLSVFATASAAFHAEHYARIFLQEEQDDGPFKQRDTALKKFTHELPQLTRSAALNLYVQAVDEIDLEGKPAIQALKPRDFESDPLYSAAIAEIFSNLEAGITEMFKNVELLAKYLAIPLAPAVSGGRDDSPGNEVVVDIIAASNWEDMFGRVGDKGKTVLDLFDSMCNLHSGFSVRDLNKGCAVTLWFRCGNSAGTSFKHHCHTCVHSS